MQASIVVSTDWQCNPISWIEFSLHFKRNDASAMSINFIVYVVYTHHYSLIFKRRLYFDLAGPTDTTVNTSGRTAMRAKVRRRILLFSLASDEYFPSMIECILIIMYILIRNPWLGLPGYGAEPDWVCLVDTTVQNPIELKWKWFTSYPPKSYKGFR